MPSTANGSGSAHDATVAIGEGAEVRALPAHERDKGNRTTAEQEYLDARADDAENAVKVVKRMIADLEKSLKDREAEAKTARAQAKGQANS